MTIERLSVLIGVKATIPPCATPGARCVWYVSSESHAYFERHRKTRKYPVSNESYDGLIILLATFGFAVFDLDGLFEHC